MLGTAAGLIGLLGMRPAVDTPHEPLPGPIDHRADALWLGLFFALLAGLPLCLAVSPSQALAMVDAFYRAVALVFGSGHMVLPLLQACVLQPDWVGNDAFLAGYGTARAVPGLLFTFAAFLGASMQSASAGWGGGQLALDANFSTAVLLIAGALPFWESLRKRPDVRAALIGVNAAVFGLLPAALVALVRWKCLPWVVVTCCAAVRRATVPTLF